MKIITTLIVLTSYSVSFASTQVKNIDVNTQKKQEVIENPTLKTLSGALNKWSLYSSYTYRGGSLVEPTSAERPNIQNAEESAGLSDMTGNIGIKYRLTKQDNFSLQLGVYSTTPFHSTLDTDNTKNQNDFDENHQNIDGDDPTLSYFRTYYIGEIQNVTFVKYQHVTRGIYRDYGLQSGIALSHAAAYKLNKASYVAASMTYENYQYDKRSTNVNGHDISLLPYQTEHKLRGNISTEFYLKRNISFRLITDIFSLYRMKEETDNQDRVLQQTIAMSYFFNRDISIAPNIRFIADDLRSDRTNLGLTVNVNL